MRDLFFEDFIPGADLPEASLAVEAEDVVFFAGTFGAGAARPGRPDARGVPLSGWHVAALGMRLLFDAFIDRTASLGAPGIDAVTWPHPVWPGDRLRLTATVAATRISASRPEMGLVTVAISLFNGDGTCVMTQDNAIMVGLRRPAARRDIDASGNTVERGGTETRA